MLVSDFYFFAIQLKLPNLLELQCDENSKGPEEKDGDADEDIPLSVLMELL